MVRLDDDLYTRIFETAHDQRVSMNAWIVGVLNQASGAPAHSRAVDLGMQCYMQGHEERFARIKRIAQEALDWADGATLDPVRVMQIIEGNE